MIERDAFELRFHAAVRDYARRVSSDLDPVELAQRIAAGEPRRHGFATTLGWSGLAVPRVAWVLLLLAVLLSAVVAGTLIAGSQPAPRLPAVLPPVGTTYACPPGSTPDEPGPVDQARPVTPRLAAFDRRAGRLIVVTGASGDGPQVSMGIETWTFDVCTNTWTKMHPSREPSSIEWRPLIYDIDSDLTILVSSGMVWAYDLQADTWSEKGVAPADATLWAYDPRSGLVVAARYDLPADRWDYDVETDTWTPILQPDGASDSDPGNPPYVVYDASVDRIVAPGGETWLFDLQTGTWSRSAAEMPRVIAGYGWQAPMIEYDEAAKQTVVFGNEQLAVYDAAADRWEGLVEADMGGSLPLSMVYDPVNRRLVGWIDLDVGGVVAFDLVARERTILLEPSHVRPVPSDN